MAVISILSGFAAMVVAIKILKKVQWALLVAIFFTALMAFRLDYIFSSFVLTVKHPNFYEVLGVIYGIYLIADTMKKSGNSKKFADSIKEIFNSKQSMALMPMMLGLLPMPGGAMFTAPMVRDIGDENKIDRLTSATVNYWFRHSMEFFWILYPAMVIYSALSGISLTRLLLLHLPIGIVGIVSGWFYYKIGKFEINHNLTNWKNLVVSLIPIFTIMIGVVAGIPGWLVVITVSLIYSFYYKNLKGIINIKWEVFLLLLFVFWYKNFIESSNLSVDFVRQLQDINLNPWWIIIISPLIIGLITGITQAAFSITMPIAITLASAELVSLVPAAVSTYYFSVIGVLFSPVHLCLLLSGEFFEVKMGKIAKKMIVPLIFCTIMYGIIFYITL